MMKYALLILLLLGAGTPAPQPLTQATQPDPPSPPKALSQYGLRSWGLDEGLPQLSVEALAQTPDGYLWVGTDDGLARFDGKRFTVFNHANTPAFTGSSLVRALHVDRQGGLWIGTQTSGLVHYADGAFTAYGEADGLAARHVTALGEDADGTLWVGTYDAGLFYRAADAPRGRFARYDDAGALGERAVGVVFGDAAGRLWVGAETGLLALGGGTARRFTRADGLPDDGILDVAEDAEGRLWVATRAGTVAFEGGRVAPAAVAARLDVPALDLLAGDGALWAGTDAQGIVRLTGADRDVLDRRTGLANDRVQALLLDHEGGLWLGTEGGGLVQLRDAPITTYTARDGLASDMVLTVFEDRSGALWAGTEGGGVTRFADGRATTYTTADGLRSDIVLSLAEDAEGVLWAGTYGGGLHRFDGRRFVPSGSRTGLDESAVFALHRGPSGTLWIGTGDGVAAYAGGAFTRLAPSDDLSSGAITSLLESADGTLWVGTVHNGLNRVRDGRVTHFDRDDGLTGETVSALYEDAEGVLWVGTYGGGLFRYADGAFVPVTDRDGLPSNNVLHVLEDDAGALWVTTSKGILRVRRDDLNAYVEGRLAELPSRVYGRHDGLRSVEMNGGVQPAGWKGRDGTLWFPTVAGVAAVHPDRARRSSASPRMVLQHVAVNGQPYDLRAGAPLAPGKTKLEIDYAALTFVAPDEVLYEYRLDGYDDGWTASSARTATYTNLPPGPYTFHVRARTHDGVWSEAPATATFYLEPFLWQTAWFRVLGALGLLGLLAGAYRVRIARLKAHGRELAAEVAERTRDLTEAKRRIEAQNEALQELDRFKTRFFANVSHEFRTPLTLIVGPLENALGGAYGTLPADMSGQMRVMLRNALRLLRLINQLLDLSKLESGKMNLQVRARNVVPFLEGILMSFTAFALQKNLDLDFEAPDGPVELFYEPDKLEKVFFNLLANAVKFTPEGGRVTLSVTSDPTPREGAPGGVVEVRVRDTGPGIPAEDLPYVFERFRQVDGSDTRRYEGTGIGLALVKELVLLHGGTVEAASTVGAGTEFTVRLLHGDRHFGPDEIDRRGAGDEEPPQPAYGAMTELASADFNAMARADDALPTLTGAPGEGSGEASAESPLVLVVDDSADLREYVGSCLRDTYRVVTAVDGRDGLEKAAALRPDVVISDIMMPGLDGYGLCDGIKSDPDLRHIPVILLSAKTSQEAINTSLEHGADEYLAKPFNGRELRARLSNLINLRAQERALKELNEHLEEKVQEQLDLILCEREVYEESLRLERDRAEEAARLKSAILNNMSHELRTPMTAILGYSEILTVEADGETRELSDFIHHNAKRLMRTLNGVLELARLEAAAAAAPAGPVHVAGVVAGAVREAEPAAAAKGLPLHVGAAPAPLHAYIDHTTLARVVSILVDNAVKFTHDGEVRVDVVEADDAVGVRVRDTGIGIGEGFLPQLFTPFQQESMGDDRAYEGIGLNLSIAKRLVDLAGGRIEVETEQGVGSTFTAWVPRSAPAGDGRPRGDAPRVAAGTPPPQTEAPTEAPTATAAHA